ncbi:MAG: metal ABC transporter permease, partial [Acholeplasmatales bacterium]|nr:metal ABC transporter permease [Acholeplasmatales bacterium]
MILINIFTLFSRTYIKYAIIVGVIMALCLALLGVSLVLKKHSMIGDGLSHVGFGAVAIALAIGWAPLYFAIPIVILASFVILY